MVQVIVLQRIQQKEHLHCKILEESVNKSTVISIGSLTQAWVKYLAAQLQLYLEEAESYAKNYMHFIDMIKQYRLDKKYTMVIFDVALLFTPVRIAETISFIQKQYQSSAQVSCSNKLKVRSDRLVANTSFSQFTYGILRSRSFTIRTNSIQTMAKVRRWLFCYLVAWRERTT